MKSKFKLTGRKQIILNIYSPKNPENMNTKILKTVKYERYIFGILMAISMVWLAELSGEKEIIFPEICALTIGAWISEQQPWAVNKRRIFLLMSAAALFGVLIVRYCPLPLILQVCICFGFTGVILTACKTNFVPIISACILPVYLKTSSFIYPAAVMVMALMIILAQWIMEKNHLRPVNKFIPCNFDLKKQLEKWTKLLTVFGLIALVPFETHQIYFLAPPLIVMFTELSNPKSPARKRPAYIAGLMTFSAFTGSIFRLLFNVYLNLPLSLCTALSCIVLFIALNRLKLNFPPAGAVLLIPMILDKNLLVRFPLEVLIGSIVLSYTAMVLFNDKKL